MRKRNEKAGLSIAAGEQKRERNAQRCVDSSGLYLLKPAMSSRSLKILEYRFLVNGDRMTL
jgi:hypothetical protein